MVEAGTGRAGTTATPSSSLAKRRRAEDALILYDLSSSHVEGRNIGTAARGPQPRRPERQEANHVRAPVRPRGMPGRGRRDRQPGLPRRAADGLLQSPAPRRAPAQAWRIAPIRGGAFDFCWSRSKACPVSSSGLKLTKDVISWRGHSIFGQVIRRGKMSYFLLVVLDI